MNKNFHTHTTAYRLNLSNVNKESFIYELVNKLNVDKIYNSSNAFGSIINYSEICNCDDGFLCEHRLQWIVDFLVEQEKIMKIKKIKNNI